MESQLTVYPGMLDLQQYTQPSTAMEKGEKSSPSPSRALNYFDTANLLGPSPFSSSSATLAPSFAHLAHIPSAFSMLGRIPPFPAPPPFGGLGSLTDPLRTSSALAHSSCTSTGGAEWWRAASEHARRVAGSTSSTCSTPGLDYFAGSLSGSYSPLFSTLAQGHGELPSPGFDMFLQPALTDKSSFLHNAFTSTSPLSMVSPLKLTTSSQPSPSSSTSSKANSSKMGSLAVTSSTSRNSSHSRRSPHKESSGKSRSRHKSSSIPTSLVSSSPASDSLTLLSARKSEDTSSLLSSSLIKHENSQNSGEKRSESDSQSDVSSPSTLSSDDSLGSSGDEKDESLSKTQKKRSRKKAEKFAQGGPDIQIDGAKKQLMADQIRQKMQGKLTMPPPSLARPEGQRPRGRGRPPKHSNFSTLDNETEEQKKKQEDLKRQLEAELKQQQLQLKLLKHAQAQKDHEVKDHKMGLPVNPKGKGQAGKVPQLFPFSNDLERAKETDKLIAKFKHFSEYGSESNHSELSSDSDMDMENEEGVSGLGTSGDSDDSYQGKSTMSEGSASPSKGDKRAADGSAEGITPHKKRRVMDEKELRIPLEHGWRRETRIRTVGSRGIAGEVLYYGPCGKKLKTYPDVIRYLEKNGITDLTRDNFSFSSKYNIGDFMEARHGENGFTVLTEEEVLGRLLWAEKRQNRPSRSVRHDIKRQQAQEVARQAMELKLRKKLEQQEMARRAAERKLLRKLEKQRQKEEDKRNKQLKVIERKKQKDQVKLMKQHEKMQRQEQLRMEREIRAQQILEARRRRKEDIEKLRYEEALRKAQDREMKRQQAVLLKEQEREWQKQMMLIANMERERRRQHMLLVKALEARKKQEERERMKEERKAEKILVREKKLEQKRLELQLAQELKQPREDLELRDLKQLPELNRLPGVKLPGQALADCIMLLEFLNTFGEALGFDSSSMPTLDTLQKGLMNDNEDDVEELMSIVTHLVQFAIDDPGVPNPKEALTKMGQKITDVEVTDTVVSEVLRVFIKARAGKQHELCQLLVDKPMEALNSTQKAAILAFLCNELLCSRVITSEIDNNIETMANLRRDKWVVEGKLRKLRIVHQKKFNRPEQKAVSQLDTSTNSMGGETDTETNLSQSLLETPNSKHGSDDEDEESGNESDGTDVTNVTGNNSEEDEPGTAEECEKKIEKLTKQHSQYRNKVFSATHKLRGMCFGQDRYKRWYWVLPYVGGVFVEGLESGQFEAETDPKSEERLSNLDLKTTEMKQRLEKCKQEILKLENGVLEDDRVIKPEPMDTSDHRDVTKSGFVLKEENGEKPVVKTEQNGLEHASNSTSDTKHQTESTSMCNGDLGASSNHSPVCKEENAMSEKDTESESNLFLEKPASDKLTESVSTDSKTEAPTEDASILKSSPQFTSSPMTNGTSNPESRSTPESKPSFLSIDSMLKKEDTGPSQYNNHFLPPGLLPDGPFSAEQMLKSLSDRQNHKPWFSILPRLACDGSSLSGEHLSSTDLPQPQLNSPMSFITPVPFRGFQVQSPCFASFQMGQIGVSPSDYNLLPVTPRNSTPAGDSFKVPSTPGECHTTSSSPAPSDLLKYEPAEPIPIPEDARHGWWRISNPDTFKNLVRALHPRGIREKDLQKSFQKYFDFVCQSCSKGDKEALVIEDSSSEAKETKEKEVKIRDEEDELTEDVDEGAPVSLTAPVPDDPEVWDASIAYDIESSILEEVEAMEDRVFTASLQVKGWKLPQKVAELEDVETVSRANTVLKRNQVYPLEVAKDKLLNLEKNIERRYLKPPFSKSVQIKLENMTSKIVEANSSERRRMEEDKKEEREESEEEREEVKDVSKEKLPAGLVAWRAAVSSATSAAQLALCLYQLNRSIAWEKSIMKVLCQLCRKDDNEAELLLCDSCDKGYHTYCFKPKMVSIPDGDWYCYECISKATGLPHCAVCGKKTGKLLECSTCPRALHMDCMENPPAKSPKKWFCPSCVAEKSKNKKGKKKPKKEEKPTKDTKKERKDSENAVETPVSETKTKKGKAPVVVDSTKDSEDLEPCRVLMPELEKHADSWPFLQPVNTKQFPQYKKYIKHPMDFSTMRIKLRDSGYKSRGEFAADARLVFDNCETFNEDDSEVGKAGHNMRKLFEQRWKELCSQNS